MTTTEIINDYTTKKKHFSETVKELADMHNTNLTAMQYEFYNHVTLRNRDVKLLIFIECTFRDFVTIDKVSAERIVFKNCKISNRVNFKSSNAQKITFLDCNIQNEINFDYCNIDSLVFGGCKMSKTGDMQIADCCMPFVYIG